MLVCKLECECVACVYSVMYVLWKEENCKCWCVGRNVCTYVYCMHILRKEENCMCQCVSWSVNVLHACIVYMFCGKRKTVNVGV